MRVTHVITRLIIGGAQENTVASVLGLNAKPGLEVQLISGLSLGPEGSLDPLFAARPDLLRVVPELVRPVHPWKDLLAFQRLTSLFRTQLPDIVHTHSGKAGILGRLAARKAGVPIVVHTIHGPSFGNFQGFLANAAFRTAEQYAGRATTHFVVVADAMREQYLRAGIGRPAQYTRILSGFPLGPFINANNDPVLRSRLGIAPGDLVVGKISRLTHLKGHPDLFRTAGRLVRDFPRLKFLLVGDGALRCHFQTELRAAGLEKHFIFAGLVPPEQVAQFVGIMDIVVHLSAREGLPRALPQALAAGKPVVAYDCDGAREVCLPGETGFLLPPGNLAELEKALRALIPNSELREKLGRRGQEFIRERFDVKAMVDALHDLYRQLARSAGILRQDPALASRDPL